MVRGGRRRPAHSLAATLQQYRAGARIPSLESPHTKFYRVETEGGMYIERIRSNSAARWAAKYARSRNLYIDRICAYRKAGPGGLTDLPAQIDRLAIMMETRHLRIRTIASTQAVFRGPNMSPRGRRDRLKRPLPYRKLRAWRCAINTIGIVVSGFARACLSFLYSAAIKPERPPARRIGEYYAQIWQMGARRTTHISYKLACAI